MTSIQPPSRDVKPFLWEGEIPHYCRRYALLQKSTGTMYPAKCKTWRCPLCGPIRAYALMDQMKGLIALRPQWYMMTLTVDPKVPGRCSASRPKDQYTKECWNTAKRSLVRLVGSMSYVWVVEFHKKLNQSTGELNNPYPHLHFLIDKDIAESDLRKIWVRAGGGFEIDIRPADTSESIIGYMLKYLKKEAVYTAKMMAARRRIWGRSRDLKTVKEMEKATRAVSDWAYIPEYIFVTEASEERRLTANQRYDRLKGNTYPKED